MGRYETVRRWAWCNDEACKTQARQSRIHQFLFRLTERSRSSPSLEEQTLIDRFPCIHCQCQSTSGSDAKDGSASRDEIPDASCEEQSRWKGFGKLTKKEIVAVLAVYYGMQESEKKVNPILARLLKAEVVRNELALHIFWLGWLWGILRPRRGHRWASLLFHLWANFNYHFLNERSCQKNN